MEKLSALCTKLEKMENLNNSEIRTLAQVLRRYISKPKSQYRTAHQQQIRGSFGEHLQRFPLSSTMCFVPCQKPECERPLDFNFLYFRATLKQSLHGKCKEKLIPKLLIISDNIAEHNHRLPLTVTDKVIFLNLVLEIG